MPTIYIDMMFLKVFGRKSHFLCLSIAMLSIELFCFVLFCFFGSQTDYSLIWIISKLNHSLFPLVASCTSREYLNGFSGFFSTPNFPSNFPQYSRCTWIIKVPSGYIINLASSIFDWSHISTVPAIMLLVPVLQSQMLLQMMGISRSCCAVSLFLLQCTR